ncbi:amidohydrolase [Nocardioides yefusunii]|uniref:Amidohydrolase n=1 Tax=Nocardioides yefusunii TaxID=2500546 RepID=A0ABW1R3V7_9ACTN|nr:amidohydrolase [Nocardioides yefusunii]
MGTHEHPTTTTPDAALRERATAVVDSHADDLVAIYQDLHAHPELGFTEHRTSSFLADELVRLGFDVVRGIGGTGVLARLDNGDGPTVMYRADMDANAVEEANDLPYRSTVRVTREDGTESPVGHMCGHDAHVTWMVGLARTLVETKDAWRGTVLLVGQPAEELIQGAQAMVDDGLHDQPLMQTPDHYVALHTAPVPVGTVACVPGTLMAGTDQIDVLIHGVGGHGSMPHVTKDPVLMAATAVVELQSVVSRRISPQATAVLTVGSIQAGADNNVIPDRALLKVNLRWFDAAVREQLVAGLRAVCDGVARTAGMSEDALPEYTFKGGSTPLVNDDVQTPRLTGVLKEVLGEDKVITQMPPVTGSEDAHLLMGPHADEIAFTYLNVGVADPVLCEQAWARGELVPYGMHSPQYLVHLPAIAVGAKVAVAAVLELLGRP